MSEKNSTTTSTVDNSKPKVGSNMRPRPLSPHLQVYKPQITSFTSIMHRATGCFLYFGAFVMVYFLASIAFWPEYNCFEKAWGNIIWKLFFFAYSVALFYHKFNGIRHLFWDAGFGFELKVAYRNAYLVFAATAIMTVITWFIILG